MIEYVRHEAILNTPDKDGTPARAHYEVRAKQGSSEAAEMLKSRDFPADLEYLYNWSMSLVGRSGMSQAGLHPLSYTEIVNWSKATGWNPNADEVDALIQLDAVYRHPETEVRKSEPVEEQKLTPVAAWPSRKNPMAD